MRNRHPIHRQQWATMIGLPIVLATCLFWLVPAATRVAALSPTAPGGPGTISGRVTNEDGMGLAGIAVAILRGADFYPTRVTKSDSDGNYQLAGIGPGVYGVRFTDPIGRYQTEYYDHALNRTDATEIVVAGNAVLGINAQLEIGGQIAGLVTGLDGAPVQSYLYLYHQQSDETPILVQSEALAQGETAYRFQGLQPGIYYLCARTFSFYEECYNDLPLTEPIEATAIPVVKDSTTANINFVIGDRADRAAITGTVVTSAGAPLSDTLVSLYLPPTDTGIGAVGVLKSDVAGHFAFPHLAPQSYALGFSDPTGHWLYQGVTIPALGDHLLPLDLTVPRHRQQLTVALMPATQITGAITFFGSVPPLSGEVVAYHLQQGQWNQIKKAELDERGHYTITGLYADTYRVGMQAWLAEAGVGGVGEYVFYGGDSIETATDLVLGQGEIRRDINWNLEAGIFDSTITGTVTAAGVPIAGIRVELWNGHPEGSSFIVYTLTDHAGNYRFDGLPESHYSVRFADPQNRYAVTYYGDVGIMAISPMISTNGINTFASIDGHLEPGGTIRGIVHRYDGTPVANAMVGAFFAPGDIYDDWAQEETPFLTDHNGEYLITGLRPGRYRVGFAPAGHLYPSEEFYGGDHFLTATDVLVEAGKVTDGINIILGPDHYVWMPLLAR